MKLLKRSILLSLIFFSICLKPQFINPERGDGFWTQVSTMRMEQIIWSNDTLYAARGPWSYTNGGAYRSIDGGVSWDTLFSVPWGSANGVRIFIHPIDKKILYIISDALYKSTNYGQSWSTILNNTTLVRLGINPKNLLIMYVTKTVPFGSVYKTTNGGTSWFEIRDGLPINVYFAAGPIAVNPEYPDTILLGTTAGLFISTNGGTNWDTTSVKGFIYNIDIHPKLNNIAFTSTDLDWSIYKTIDYGKNWYKTLGGKAVNKCIFNFQADSIVYNSGNLKSTNYGNDWSIIDSLSGWTDITNDKKLNTQMYATVGAYGLYTFTDIVLNVNEIRVNDKEFQFQSYPNPFNSITTIQFIIPEQKEISVQVFDILGRLVKTIVPSSLHNAGQYNYFWDGKNDNNIPVSSGVYLTQIFIKHNNLFEVNSLKMILLK